MDLSEFEEGGAEYRFLLQPVRDLATNWDIDVSGLLQDYVRKLTGDSEACNVLDEHGRRKIFNFAEAAVLIHGTTNVYSKKVEYVYQLAANFFDQLKEDKHKKRRKEHGEDGAEGGHGSDDDAGDTVYKNPFLNPEKRKARLESMRNTLLKLTKKRPCLPLVPIAFTPLADFEKTDVPLYNRLNSKEVIGKKDDFKMNTCHIYEAVALLDLKNAELIDRFTSFNDENQPEYGGPKFREPKQEFSAVEADRDATVGFEDYGQAELTYVDALIESSVAANSYANGQDEIASLDHPQPKFSSMGFDGAHHERENVPMFDATNVAAEPADDEEELLDPFEVKSDKSRPFKMNKKCCTVAAKQIKMRDYRIAKECQLKGVPNVPSVKNYIDSRMYRRKIKKRSFAFAQFNSFLMDQALLALNASIYEEEKRRAEIKKKREIEAKNALREARRSQRRSRRNPTASIDMVARHPSDVAHEEPQYEDAADELGADEIIDDNEPEQPEEFHHLGDYLHVDDLEDSLRVANLYADGSDNFGGGRNRGHFSSFAGATQNIYDDTICPDVAYPDELPPRPVSQMEYDELVAYHLRKYWSTAEEATSKFCERVQKWEERMTPLLEKEYAHREFDTRQYGDELMEAFQNKLGETIDFGSVIRNSVDYDMSRYLLVSLIMANTQNLEVLNTGSENMDEGCRNNLKLKLVKLERHHQVFEEEQLLVSGKNSV